MKKTTRYWKCIIVYAVLLLILNVLSRISAFCDVYTEHVFLIWTNTYGRITGLFPFSVGEVMILLAIFAVIAAIIVGISLLFFRKRKRKGYKLFAIRYLKGMLLLAMTTGLLYSLNCSMLYGCSKLVLNEKEDSEYTVTQVEALRTYMTEKCNALSKEFARDTDGNLVADFDVKEEVQKAMSGLAKEYPRFSGYISEPKPIRGSYYMYYTNMIGIYFPFSLEANYSIYLNDANFPYTACHELAHVKGYIYENEADYFAFLACIGSDNPLLQYSGYINVLYYLDADYYSMVDRDTYEQQVQIEDFVWMDMYCYTDEVEEEVKAMDSIIGEEVVAEAGETFTETYLDYYGAEANYSEVTKLVLRYYDGILYETGD